MQDYDEFVEKFKPKLTTNECYTPNSVYEAVKTWVVKEYGLDGCEVVRPFWPGGDYENLDYPDGCVVIDNPPFSILSKIKGFYNEHRVKYFLFAPHLTLFSSNNNGEQYIVTHATITYANGAAVNTSFVTNLDSSFIRTAPKLKQVLQAANEENKNTKERPKYKYPSTVISASLLGKITSFDFRLGRDECSVVKALDSQKKFKKAIFGGGFFISEKKAAEFRAAELRAAELRAAELRAAELRAAEDAIKFELSDREREIISAISNHTGTLKGGRGK